MKSKFALFCSILSLHVIAQPNLRVYSLEQALNAPVDSVLALSLHKSKLTAVPAEVARFTQLIRLDLSHNKISILPPFLGEFKKLESLDLSRNKLDSFPEIILHIGSLKRLILNRNNIPSLPENLALLQHLSYLDLWDNPISDFPNAFTEMPQLKQLHVEGILYGPKFQEKWRLALPGVKIFFDPPCDCREE